MTDSPSQTLFIRQTQISLSKHLGCLTEIIIIVHNLLPQPAALPARLTIKQPLLFLIIKLTWNVLKIYTGVQWKVDATRGRMQDLHPYLCNSFFPAFNNLVSSDCELEGLVPVSRGVKLLSILQRACHKQLQHTIVVKNQDLRVFWFSAPDQCTPFLQELTFRIKVSKIIVAEVLFRILVLFQFPK